MRRPTGRQLAGAFVAGLIGLAALSPGSGDSDARNPAQVSATPSAQTARVDPVPVSDVAPASPTPAASPPPSARPELTTLNALDGLQVVDRHPVVPPYRRDAFGSSWADTDHNGCNQRDDVLLRDAVPGTVRTAWQGRCEHDVLAGTWVDPYTGRRIVLTDAKEPRQSIAVQIDHIVPLGEAWASGASEWDSDRRHQFANDLTNLLAVDGPTNASKSDDDPAAWRPRKDFQCRYAKRWIAVKAHWDLGADSSEVRALREMVGFC